MMRLKSSDDLESQRALNEFCTIYWQPLYSYIRRRGLDHHDAQDVLHDFLAKLLRLKTFLTIDSKKGQLHSLLSSSLQRFIINWHRDNKWRRKELSIEAEAELAEAEGRYQRGLFVDADSPERIFERMSTRNLLNRILERLSELYTQRGRAEVFKTLLPVLLTGGSLRGEDSELLAATMNMTAGALRVTLNRLLKDYRTLLVEEVRLTVADDGEVKDEISYLHQVFSKG